MTIYRYVITHNYAFYSPNLTRKLTLAMVPYVSFIDVRARAKFFDPLFEPAISTSGQDPPYYFSTIKFNTYTK